MQLISNKYFIIIMFVINQVVGQSYPPSVGKSGTTAIYKDSSAIKAWATGCEITRGYQNIYNKALGQAAAGDATMSCGKADGSSVVSLGDGGTAICTFQHPITNGVGFDFVVFENSFDDLFLELAFVEVSSDGIHFFRFPCHSLTDASIQTASFGSTNPTMINNLAGKYRGGYGTPFDLQELNGKNGLNVQAITHIKIIDVIGSVNGSFVTYDSFGNKINDPWPTEFPSGGFDLDAIGVIHQATYVSLNETTFNQSITLFPNPIEAGNTLKINSINPISLLELIDISGKVISQSTTSEIIAPSNAEGFFILRIKVGDGITFKRVILTKQ